MDLSQLEPIFEARRAALLICDMQNDYVKPGGELAPPMAAVVAAQRRLLEQVRARGLPVGYTRRLYRRDGLHSSPVHKLWLGGRPGLVWEGTSGAAVVDELQPRPDDLLIDKIRYSAFFQTPLETLLRGLGVTYLLLAGVSTHWGVEATARDAEQRDLIPIVVSDACASSEAEMHEASLRNVASFIGFVATTDEALALLAGP
jgi:ureidoacrylate peracid hydrolase